jgi:hypothetical protein
MSELADRELELLADRVASIIIRKLVTQDFGAAISNSDINSATAPSSLRLNINLEWLAREALRVLQEMGILKSGTSQKIVSFAGFGSSKHIFR